MLTFLQDGKVSESEIDKRGTAFPDPPVYSMDELKAQIASKISIKPNGGGSTTVDSIATAPPQLPVENETKKKQQQSSSLSTPPKSSKASTEGGETNDNIDVSKLDIRVGTIIKAWEHPEADKLFCEEIDIGEDQPRLIASGLRSYYKVDELPGQRVLVLANLKARKMMGFESHGMVLCASRSSSSSSDNDDDDSDNTKTEVQFVVPPIEAPVGERMIVPGYEGEPATENQILKKKMLDRIFPDLNTNANGFVTYKGVPMVSAVAASTCQPTFPNSNVA